MPPEGCTDVDEQVAHGLQAQGYGSRICEVVRRCSPPDWRCYEYRANSCLSRSFGGAKGELRRVVDIGVDWQVMTMLLDGPGWDDDQCAMPVQGCDLVPPQFP